MAGPARAPRRYARGMCGRYTLTQQGQLVADLELALDHPVAGPVREDGADAAELAWWRPRWNIAPTQPAPVVLLEDGARVLHLLRWGLVPHWAKDLRVGASMINARAETVFDKPAFRDAIRRRRCLVPADGFYEWLRPDGPRGRALPQYIAPPPGTVTAFAGIWERWRDPTGRWQRSYAIVTVPPDPIVAGIHDRMPLVLPRAARAAWLDPSLTEPDAVRALLAPGPLVGWTVRAVSPRVGKPEHDDPACLDAPTEAELAPALPPARRPAGRARKPPSGQGSLF